MSGWNELLGKFRRRSPDVDLEGNIGQEVDRGMPRVQRTQSMSSRLTHLFALGLVGLMGAGVLTWYYANAAPRPELERALAERKARDKASGDQVLPKLPPLEIPKYLMPPSLTAAASEGSHDVATSDIAAEAHVTGELYVSTGTPTPHSTHLYASQTQASLTPQASPDDSADLALARQLGGTVFARSATGGLPVADSLVDAALPSRAGNGSSESVQRGKVKARALGALNMHLPKGAVIECTLLAAIDSMLPGLTTCVTATDVFGADGTVVLLERGTRLVGEASAEVKAGQTRVRVIWSEARTPAGVSVDLASPGTDALGRSGVPGTVDRRFVERFGAAVLLSVIDGAIAVGVESQRARGSSSVVVSSGTSRDIATEVLRDTVGIPPRIRVAQGARVAVLVARDVDFAEVYELVQSKR